MKKYKRRDNEQDDRDLTLNERVFILSNALTSAVLIH
jgi:hypothetical protein